jgi:hypothetical protein
MVCKSLDDFMMLRNGGRTKSNDSEGQISTSRKREFSEDQVFVKENREKLWLR